MHGTIDSLFLVEWRPLAALADCAAPWRALAARTLEPNVFYEPAFALAAAPALGRDVGAGLVWSRVEPAQLLGFFPARIERRRYGLPIPLLVGWTHPFGPLGTPLIDREAATAVLSAWLDHVAGDASLPNLMLLPFLPAAGAIAQAFDDALARRNGVSAAFAAHCRALLAPVADRQDYLDRAVGAKKRKELRRQRKRLAETGAVTSSIARAPAEVAAALGDFLVLEASGWKGRAGTAARADRHIRVFMETALEALAREGKARVARMLVGGQPIAALVTLQSGASAWCWKIAHDEAFARFSPGVQVLLEETQALLDDSAVACADSCATAGHPMIDHIWRERLALADRLICLAPRQRHAFALAAALERLRRGAIAGLKRLRDLARSRS